LDGLLADIRKNGFKLVTVLLTANALLTPQNVPVAHLAASAAIMGLIVVLHTVARYWIMLDAAAELASDLEEKLPVQTTTYLRAVALRTGANAAIASIYDGFVLVAAGIAGVAFFPQWSDCRYCVAVRQRRGPRCSLAASRCSFERTPGV